MEMTGQYEILAPRQVVWRALNDAAILKSCLRGCEQFERASETSFDVVFTTKVGPIKTTFSAAIALSDVRPPEAYTLSGEGKGGAAGFAKGSASVQLTESSGTTVLRYSVNASLKGKIGQMGSRIVDDAAKSMADEFFGRFAGIVSAQSPAAEPESPAAGPLMPGRSRAGRMGWYLLAAGILAAAAVAILSWLH